MARDGETALAWAEEITGGTVVAKHLQARWRPQWFVDLRMPDGSISKVLLRGLRNPGYLGDETVSRVWLTREAAVIRALQATPVKVPRYYGYEEELGWVLMEWVEGTELLTEVADAARRRGLYRQYMDNAAELHALDPASLDLPEDFAPPQEPRDVVLNTYRMASGLYEAAAPDVAEPLLTLGRWWIERHAPDKPHAVTMCAGDIGPNQFIFEGDTMKAMFDLEMARVGDPYEDLGLMRLRELCYPIGELPDHLRYYADRTGEPLDLELLQYWTVVGMISGPLWFWDRAQRPDPHLPDQISIYSYEPIYRRGLAEALMEVYDVDPDVPQRPAELDTSRTRLHELLVGQLEESYLPSATDPDLEFRLRGTAALAESLAVGNAIGAQLESEDLDELGDLLGRRPESVLAGLAELETQIRQDPEADLERQLRVLHRMRVRREFLHEPMQRSMGFASNQPLARMT